MGMDCVDEAIGTTPPPPWAEAALRPLSCPLPGLALWRVNLLDASWLDGMAMLSTDEQARAARFVFDRDRRRHRASHVALRRLIGRRLGRDPSSLAFAEGPHGKPALEGAGCVFNLSHSADVALVGIVDTDDPVAAGEIGVDIEMLREVDDLWSMARRNFTAHECEELAALEAADRPSGFLRCWTRKEACLKAIGSGLSIAPERFEAGVSPAGRWVDIDCGAAAAGAPWRVWVESIDPGADALAAVACVQAVPMKGTISR